MNAGGWVREPFSPHPQSADTFLRVQERLAKLSPTAAEISMYYTPLRTYSSYDDRLLSACWSHHEFWAAVGRCISNTRGLVKIAAIECCAYIRNKKTNHSEKEASGTPPIRDKQDTAQPAVGPGSTRSVRSVCSASVSLHPTPFPRRRH
jgi:hypothetical protein